MVAKENDGKTCVTCDDCGKAQRFTDVKDLNALLERLRDNKWFSNRPPGSRWKHYCPTCRAKRVSGC